MGKPAEKPRHAASGRERIFDLVFVAMPDSVVRIRSKHGIHGTYPQVTFRCGMCYQPVPQEALRRHFDEHYQETFPPDEE